MNQTTNTGAAHFSTLKRFSIDGWKVTYFEPTYGARSFLVHNHAELAKEKAWLDAGGYVYSIKEIIAT